MCDHKWKYDTPSHRTCIVCSQHQKEKEYSGWQMQEHKEHESDVKEYDDYIKKHKRRIRHETTKPKL